MGQPAGDDVDYEKLDNPPHHLEGHAEEGEGPWLMSFADMVTLLMCFFIIFFQTDMGNIKIENPDELLQKLEQLQKLLGMENTSKIEVPDPDTLRTTSGASGMVDNFEKSMRSVSRNLDLVFTIGSPQPGEIEMTFLNTRFFKSGQADLTPKGMTMVKTVAKKLKKIASDAVIEVEGHTDSDPIQSWKFPSNWELSGSRAASVVRVLADLGLEPQNMRATGRAHFEPLVPEQDRRGRRIRENQALNRRVVVRVKHRIFAEAKKSRKGRGNE